MISVHTTVFISFSKLLPSTLTQGHDNRCHGYATPAPPSLELNNNGALFTYSSFNAIWCFKIVSPRMAVLCLV